MQKLSPNEIQDKLEQLKSWHIEGETLQKEFIFADFAIAIAFMNRLVPVAEKLNHHPDWANSYNKVSISLTSHEIQGLTDNDFSFAAAADTAAHDLT
jgi:4a-hydroxytetrahydrobiopterin dehydratase